MPMPSSVSTRLRYQHKSLLDFISTLSDEQIRSHPVPGKWSIFEQIVHLQTYQLIFIARIKQMLEGENPLFPRYKADDDPVFLEYCGKSSREVIQDLLSIRKQMASELPAFAKEDFDKTGTHPVFGTLNLLEWIHFFLLHEAHHMFVVFKMAAELRKG
jgi:uncharacterized damage-inducible protein DinB